jgi:hypothetical protein
MNQADGSVNPEIVMGVALQFTNCKAVLSLPPPNRHHHLFSFYRDVDFTLDHRQGFITSRNRFVDRKEALILALATDQIMYRKDGYMAEEGGDLFSENLW